MLSQQPVCACVCVRACVCVSVCVWNIYFTTLKTQETTLRAWYPISVSAQHFNVHVMSLWGFACLRLILLFYLQLGRMLLINVNDCYFTISGVQWHMWTTMMHCEIMCVSSTFDFAPRSLMDHLLSPAFHQKLWWHYLEQCYGFLRNGTSLETFGIISPNFIKMYIKAQRSCFLLFPVPS